MENSRLSREELERIQSMTSPLKALYVEDDEIIRGEVAKLLLFFFPDLETAGDGEEGLEKYREGRHDLVVTDLQMPRMDGLEMIEKIREEGNEVAVFITTAFGEEEYVMRAIELGVDRYLKKPVTLAKMIDALAKFGEERSRRRELEEKNRLLLHNARFAAMGEILTNIAHHWRNPLNAIAMVAQDLQDAYESEELDREYMNSSMEIIMKTLRNLSATIDQFGAFFKPDGEEREFELGELLEKTVQVLSPAIRQEAVEVEIEGCRGVTLYGYPKELGQALFAVLNNGMEAVYRRVGEGALEKGWIRVECRRDGEWYEVRVTDNGGGFAQEEVRRVFEPYNSTKGPASGTGLGLYVARMIVESHHGGKIQVENVDAPGGGQGACVLLRLPVKEQA